MSEPREDLLQKLNDKIALQSTDPQGREIIGLLAATIQTLGKEIDELNKELEEIKDDVEHDQKKTKWYSER